MRYLLRFDLPTCRVLPVRFRQVPVLCVDVHQPAFQRRPALQLHQPLISPYAMLALGLVTYLDLGIGPSNLLRQCHAPVAYLKQFHRQCFLVKRFLFQPNPYAGVALAPLMCLHVQTVLSDLLWLHHGLTRW